MADDYAIMLPIGGPDLEKIQTTLRASQSIVALIVGDLYQVQPYINPFREFKKFNAMIDRNVYTRIAALSFGTPIPSNQLDDHRWAAAVLAFCQLAEIRFDYASSLYEYAHTSTGDKAVAQMQAFRLSDNANLNTIVDFAVGRTNSLSISSELPADILVNKISGTEFEKQVRNFRWNYLFLLKIAEIGRCGAKGPEQFDQFLCWMRDELCFAAPATMWASTYFARGCPKGMLDSHSKASVSNVAWDLTLIQDWRPRAMKGQETNEPWLLISRDKLVRLVASRLIAENDAEAESFFSDDWGKSKGKAIHRLYRAMQESIHNPATKRNPNPSEDIARLTEALELRLGIT
jgi:hypothetical protein